MLGYDRFDISGGIEINNTSDLHQCIVCHYYCFFKTNFRFQPREYDGCHDIMQESKSFTDMAIVTVKENGYKILFGGIIKVKPVSRKKNADLSEKSGQL